MGTTRTIGCTKGNLTELLPGEAIMVLEGHFFGIFALLSQGFLQVSS